MIDGCGGACNLKSGIFELDMVNQQRRGPNKLQLQHFRELCNYYLHKRSEYITSYDTYKTDILDTIIILLLPESC